MGLRLAVRRAIGPYDNFLAVNLHAARCSSTTPLPPTDSAQARGGQRAPQARLLQGHLYNQNKRIDNLSKLGLHNQIAQIALHCFALLVKHAIPTTGVATRPRRSLRRPLQMRSVTVPPAPASTTTRVYWKSVVRTPNERRRSVM